MVGRLELILAIIFALVLVVALDNNTQIKKANQESQGKSIEIENAKLVEANATNRLYEIKAIYVYQQDNIWHFQKVILTSPDIKYLRADSAIRAKDYIELVGNVVMLYSDGSKYRASRAIYLTDKKIFYTLGKFIATKSGSVALGKNFYHSKLKGFSRAEKVHIIYQMASKGNKRGH